jgi:hypothetical protein
MMSKMLLVAIALVGFNAHAETKVNLSGDAYVRSYFVNGLSPYKTNAFSQFFRLNVDAKPDDNLTIRTGVVLAGENWEGDSHKPANFVNPTTGTVTATNGTAIGGTNEDGGNGNITHLDHAVIDYKKDGWITSVGRLPVSSPGNFLTSDDRRDRIQVLKIFNNYHVLALVYDKRAEGSLSNGRDDVDMYSINYYGLTPHFKYALQTGYWVSKKYNAFTSGFNGLNLDNIKQFTPQLEGKLIGIDYKLYYTILYGGSANYKSDHHSAALRLTKDFDMFVVDAQSIWTKRGGLIAGGFDTLSSVVNNSPDHNQSQIKMRTIGFGLGNKTGDEWMHMVKFSKEFSPEFSASVGGGFLKVLPVYTATTIEKNTVLDATAKYTFSKNLNLAAAYGKFFGDNKDHAGSLTLNANF